MLSFFVCFLFKFQGDNSHFFCCISSSCVFIRMYITAAVCCCNINSFLLCESLQQILPYLAPRRERLLKSLHSAIIYSCPCNLMQWLWSLWVFAWRSCHAASKKLPVVIHLSLFKATGKYWRNTPDFASSNSCSLWFRLTLILI